MLFIASIVHNMFSDSSIKSGIAHAFHAMAMHSPDTAKNVASDVLPLVFLAMHATAKDDGKETF